MDERNILQELSDELCFGFVFLLRQILGPSKRLHYKSEPLKESHPLFDEVSADSK